MGSLFRRMSHSSKLSPLFFVFIFPGQCPVLSIIVLLPLFERGSQISRVRMQCRLTVLKPYRKLRSRREKAITSRTCLQKIKCCTAQLPWMKAMGRVRLTLEACCFRLPCSDLSLANTTRLNEALWRARPRADA